MAEPSSAAALPQQGRVAIVTSASRDIGRAIVAHLTSPGAHLVVNYASSSAQADLLVSDLNASSPPPPPRPRAIAFRADVAEVKALFDAEAAFGGPAHVLVCYAGVLDAKCPPLVSTAEEDWDPTFAVNARGAFLYCREAANRLARGDGGRIVTIFGSLGALWPGYAAYTASKAALEVMTCILVKELRGMGITANAVAPGPVATDMFFSGKSEEDVWRVVETIPLGRLGEPRDIPRWWASSSPMPASGSNR